MQARISPATTALSGVFDPPSSKNYTTRYIVASCLAEGTSTVLRPAVQDDAVACVACCRALGAEITALDSSGAPLEFSVDNRARIAKLEIIGFGGSPRLASIARTLNPGNAGAVFRILLAVSALLPEVTWQTDHADSLGKRPNVDLLEALAQLGVEHESEGIGGCLPIRLRGGIGRIRAHLQRRRASEGIAEGEPLTITVSGSISSQFTSALLFLVPLLGESIRVAVTGRLLSLPLVETTRHVLDQCGITVESNSERSVHLIRSGQKYAARRWETNGDWPGAAAMLAAAACVPGSRIALRNLFEDDQGEREAANLLAAMGCSITREVSSHQEELLVISTPETPLQGRGCNGDLCTDAVPPLLAPAMLAEGETRFSQVRNLQFKECDRIREPIEELRKVLQTNSGLTAEQAAAAIRWEPIEDPDVIRIEGTPAGFEGGITVDGRGDHRVIMLLSIIALRCRSGLVIAGAEHVAKSFPGWFEFLRAAGVRLELVGD